MLLHNRIRDMAAAKPCWCWQPTPRPPAIFPKFCSFLGHELLEQDELDGSYRYLLRKGGETRCRPMARQRAPPVTGSHGCMAFRGVPGATPGTGVRRLFCPPLAHAAGRWRRVSPITSLRPRGRTSTCSFIAAIILPVPCTRRPTGVLPGTGGGSCRISATGMPRMGATSEQQLAFEAVEAKPQALEWLFSLACGYPFLHQCR